MKKTIFTTLLFFSCLLANAQGYYTHYYGDKKLLCDAEAWIARNEWRNGFNAASPDKSVNAIDFYVQYQKNTKQWNALFHWLANTDLLAIPSGKHPIEGTKLVASVEDSKNEELCKRQSESHYHHIDFQFVVKGVERFGVIDHYTSKPNCKYRPDVIHYDYDLSKTRFMDSEPQKFYIFFPGDWHIAKVKTNEDNQDIRVIVIKVDYVE